jgi:hypothetical protein
MSAMPNSVGLQLHFVFLAYRLRDCGCALRHLDPLGKVSGKDDLPGFTWRSLPPHLFDPGIAKLIDLCVTPTIKEQVRPWDWHLILSESGATPKMPGRCFKLRRVPLIMDPNDKTITINLFTERLRLHNLRAGRDPKGRMRSLWWVEPLARWDYLSLNCRLS